MGVSLITTAQKEFSSNTIQIGVVVSDLQASVAFYTDVIGMQKTGAFNVTSSVAKATGLTDGIPLEVEVLKLEDSPEATEWKLMSFGNKGSKDTYINEGVGMRYITIFVNDLKTVVSRIKKNKIPMLGDTPTKLPDGRYFILVQDPDGVFIELIGNYTS